MLRDTDPGWTPQFALPRPRRLTTRTRWLWAVPLIAGILVAFGWIASHDPGPGLALTGRGWATIGAAVIVAALVASRRSEGLGQLLRTVTEYAVVAALVVLLVTASAHPDQTIRKAKPGSCPPVVHVRAWLDCLWKQASKAATDAGKQGGHQ
jgi:peptidoglycan/LPS O-acetylase OafA/YrhL